MALCLSTTLNGSTETFAPLKPDRVRMYSCGPTVKEPINLAKFRSFLLADVTRRVLQYCGYEVNHVMNITDVGHLNEFEEDVIEVAAARKGLYPMELIAEEERIFHEDRRGLRVLDAHTYPHAREHIDDMIDVIRELEATGKTYVADGNLYLDITADAGFGRLTHASLDELIQLQKTSRTPQNPNKRHALDIDLWRTDIKHQAHWPSPWGRGFPGWHVECVAMSRKYLGASFDIHTGGHENTFPHHECELAQAAALGDEPLARYWLHSGPVLSDGKPMSLQNRNMLTVRELLEAGLRGPVVRVALLLVPYRETLDFGESLLDVARGHANTLLGFHEHLVERTEGSAVTGESSPPDWVQAADAEFVAAIENDLDYPGALDTVVRAIDQLSPEAIGDPQQCLNALKRWDRVLGILS